MNPYRIILILIGGIPVATFAVYALVVIASQSVGIPLRAWLQAGVFMTLLVGYIFLIRWLAGKSSTWKSGGSK